MRKPKIYIASKTYNAPIIKEFVNKNRNLFESTSTWIDFDQNSYFVKHQKGKLWDVCLNDIKKCDFMILYSHSYEDDHNGALVELGMALSLSKEIFEVGSSFRTTECENSDVAYTHHAFYTKLEQNNLDDALHFLIKTTDYFKEKN